MVCSFLSTETDKIECFKECPFFLNLNEEFNCPFMALERKTYKKTFDKYDDYEYLFFNYNDNKM